MNMLILLTILQIVSSNVAYNFTCPSSAHWKIRAKSLCEPPRNYTCLFDVTFRVNVYRERCSRPRILAEDIKCYDDVKLTRSPYLGDMFNNSRTIKIIEFDNFKYNLNYPTNKYRIKAAASIGILLLSYFGKESAGKTCLLRRLLKEDITDVTSTDGVDIVVRRCKINIEDGKWTIGKGI
ncbi:unnamed protein product [Mytilus edulis]|uniref:Uncharacterized protein n=1 Tax=Mytilus edulis TaxID=6550 RepID=A0A8S3QJQ6_MYTED|nr:unnamed protein product [Mytilus edulis]